MSRLDAFLDTFFNTAVMQRYLPDIVAGFFVTCTIAVLVVVSGLALAVLRSYKVIWVNSLIIIFC